jgi:hypothetical protein
VDNQALALLFRFALHAAAINEHRVDSRETRRLNFLFVLAVGLVAGTLSGIVGTGSSIMLMPVLIGCRMGRVTRSDACPNWSRNPSQPRNWWVSRRAQPTLRHRRDMIRIKETLVGVARSSRAMTTVYDAR